MENRRLHPCPGAVWLLLVGLLLGAPAGGRAAAPEGECWLTRTDRTALFQKQPGGLRFDAPPGAGPVIEIDDAQTYQTIAGFGFTLTGGSARLLQRLPAAVRADLLRELFATDRTNIGVSYLRLSLGASDLDERVFSYDDLPPGQTDPTLARFSLAPDEEALIPMLREILAVQPAVALLATPWSAPAWMKQPPDTRGGRLRPELAAVYARYFVKYLQGMRAAGIPIGAVTVQNEPLNGNNQPSQLMTAPEQAALIKHHLGPALRAAGLGAQIILYDHNADHPEYPLAILADPGVRPFVAGSAFHLYAGSIGALSRVHEAHPDKAVYFTEQWMSAPGNLGGDLGWHLRQVLVGATRNWSSVVLEWNLAADEHQQPHTAGGCERCLGALTIAGREVTRNPAYYVIAHAAKFVRPGSVRVASSLPPNLPNVAFRTPDGRRVLIVLNAAGDEAALQIQFHETRAAVRLPAGAAATYVW